MRILHVISAFPPAYAYGGGLRVAYEIAKEQVRLGHNVTVFTTDAYDSKRRLVFRENPELLDGIEVFRFKNLSNWLAHWGLPIAPSLAMALRRRVPDFDIVHVHEYRSLQTMSVRKYTKKNGIPYVLHPDASLPKVLGKKRLKAVFDFFWGHGILNDACRVIAISNEEVNDARKMGLQPQKVPLIRCGMDLSLYDRVPARGSFRRRFSISEETKLMLYLGRIHKSKGIDFAIKALPLCSRDIGNSILVVAGPDDGFRNECERLVRSLGIGNRVMFTGMLTEDEKYDALGDSDLFIHTVRYMGGVGFAPLEAVMCGTPVIVTEGCGEIVREANCGYIVSFGDVADLADKMKRALENPDEGREMVKRGRDYIRSNLGWEMIVDKIIQQYGECMMNKKRGNP